MSANAEDITVVRLRRDPLSGDQVLASEHVLADCVVAPATSTEDYTTGQGVDTSYSVFVLGDADITASDRVRRPGDPEPSRGAGPRALGPWIVVGEPAVWRSPFSEWAPGKVVTIRRSTG